MLVMPRSEKITRGDSAGERFSEMNVASESEVKPRSYNIEFIINTNWDTELTQICKSMFNTLRVIT